MEQAMPPDMAPPTTPTRRALGDDGSVHTEFVGMNGQLPVDPKNGQSSCKGG